MYCLKDKHLSNQEIDELKYLKEILTLNDIDVEKIHNDVSGKIYLTLMQLISSSIGLIKLY